MSQEQVAKLNLDIQSNVEQRIGDFERFYNAVQSDIRGFEQFSTKVDSFGDAMALAFEEPQRKLQDFVSVVGIGFQQMQSGLDNLPGGVETVTFGLTELAKRIGPLQGFVPVFQNVGKAAKSVSSVVNALRSVLGGVGRDWINITNMATQIGYALRDQGKAWKIQHDEEVRYLRETVALRQSHLNQVNKEIDAYEREKTELAKAGATKSEIAKIDKLIAENLKEVDLLTRAVAEAQDKYNIQMRVAGPLMNTARGHLSTLATDIRHMSAGMQKNGEIAVQRFKDAQLQIEAYRTAIARLGKLGIEVPEEMNATFRKNLELMGIFQREIRKQSGQSSNVIQEITNKIRGMFQGAAKGAQAAGRQIGEQTKGLNRWQSSLENAAQSNRMLAQYVAPQGIINRGLQHVGSNITMGTKAAQGLSLSLGSVIGVAGALGGVLGQIDPAFSTLIVGASQLADQFSRSFTAMIAVSGTAAERIKAAMSIISNSLLGFGLAATGIIVKSGLLGAEVRTLEMTMLQIARNLAGEAGVDVDKFAQHVENLRDAVVNTGITTREATTAISQFLRARLPIGQVENLANAAKNLGVTVANMSSSEVFGRFIEFISTGNSALLDAIGITKTANMMYEEYAKENDLVAKSMSPMQKQLALINGLMKETVTVAGVYDKAMETAGKQLSSMKRLFEEAILAFGERAEPILAKLITGMNKLLKWFNALPDEVLDNIFVVVKWTAALGTLLGAVVALGPAIRALAPAIGAVGRAIATSMPWMLAISAAIGAIVLVVRGFKSLWDQNWNDIQGSVKLLVDTLRTEFAPVIDLIKASLSFLSTDLKILMATVTDVLQGSATRLSEIFMAVKDALGPVFITIKSIIYGAVMFIHNMMMALNEYLKGDTERSQQYVEKAFRNIVTIAKIVFQDLIRAALDWGKGLAVNFARGLWDAAKVVVVQVLTAIGNLIGGFFKPGSPPKEGPLRGIVEWGKGIMDTFLRAFKLADFGVLRDVVAPIQQALRSAVAAEDITEKESKQIFSNVRTQVAELLADFRKTGKINEEILGDISKKLGEGGKEYIEYIRRTLEYQQALRSLEDVRADVAEAEAAGFVSKELKDRLSKAEAEVDAKKEAVEWQKEFLAAMQEGVDLQNEMVEALKKVGKAIEKIADTEFKLDFEPPKEGEKLDLGIDIEPIDWESVLAGFSSRFSEAEREAATWIDNLREFIDLPFNEKLTVMRDRLREIAVISWQRLWSWLFRTAQQIDEVRGTNFTQWVVNLYRFATRVGEILRKVFNFIISIPEKIRNFFSGIGKFLAATGILGFFLGLEAAFALLVLKLPALIALFGKLKAIGIVSKIVGGLASGFETLQIVGLFVLDALGKVASFIASTLGPVLAQVVPWVALIAATLYGIWANKDQLIGFWRDFTTEVSKALDALRETFKTEGGQQFIQIMKTIGQVLWNIVKFALNVVIAALGALWDAVKSILPQIAGLFNGVFSIIYGLIKAVILPVFNLLVAVIQALAGDNEAAMESLRRAWENLKEGVMLILGGLIKGVANAFAGVFKLLVVFVLSFFKRIGAWVVQTLSKFGILREDAVGIWNSIWEDIIDGIEAFFEKVVEWAQSIYDKLVGKSIFTDLRDKAVEIWQEMWDSIIDGVHNFITVTLPQKWTELTSWFGEKVAEFTTIGNQIIENIVAGVSEKIQWAKEKLMEFWGKLRDIFPGSEPKDRSSPLYNLGASGKAMMENFIKGAQAVKVEHLMDTNLSRIASGLQAAAVAQNTNRNYNFYDGAMRLSFPGVSTQEDARGIGQILQDQIDRASAIGHFGGSRRG